MTRTPSNLEVQYGFSMTGITKAARRFESLHEFKTLAREELEAKFTNAEWDLRIASPFEYGLVHNAETGNIDDGDLQNWLNVAMAESGIELEASVLDETACRYDRAGCWWKIRSFLLDECDKAGETQPYTASQAARQFVEQHNSNDGSREPRNPLGAKVSRTTARELEQLHYRLTVQWPDCPDRNDPRDDSGSAPTA